MEVYQVCSIYQISCKWPVTLVALDQEQGRQKLIDLKKKNKKF